LRRNLRAVAHARFLAAVLFALVLAFFSSEGCRRHPKGRAPPRPAPAKKARASLGGAKDPGLDLPVLSPPPQPSAKRVLRIFHTSNVAGDIDPCG
jgi:hypothetical protein